MIQQNVVNNRMGQDINKETSDFLLLQILYKYLLLSLHKCMRNPQNLCLYLRVRVFFPGIDREEFIFSPFINRLVGMIFLAPFQTGCYRYVPSGYNSLCVQC
jgi:hypothetical protein